MAVARQQAMRRRRRHSNDENCVTRTQGQGARAERVAVAIKKKSLWKRWTGVGVTATVALQKTTTMATIRIVTAVIRKQFALFTRTRTGERNDVTTSAITPTQRLTRQR